MMGAIPFEIPSQFYAGLANGSITRVGTLLKDTGTGKILAHVQETGVTQNLLDGLNLSTFSPLKILNTASSGYANVQLAQLKALVSGMQMLQYANLGVAVAGIGISLVGFTLLNKKLKKIESQVSMLKDELSIQFRELYERELRGHFSHMEVLFQRAELAHTLTNSSKEWLDVSSLLASESGYLKGEVLPLTS